MTKLKVFVRRMTFSEDMYVIHVRDEDGNEWVSPVYDATATLHESQNRANREARYLADLIDATYLDKDPRFIERRKK